MATKINLKELNRKSVYQAIYRSDGISKQELSQMLRLSLPTISQNLAELKGQGLIKEDGTFDSTGGRKAKIIRCVTDIRMALGLDITKNHISLVLVDIKGEVLKWNRPRLRYEDTEDYYQAVGSHLRNFLAESGIDQSAILGVGVSLPAIVSGNQKYITYLKVLEAPDNLYEKLQAVIPFPFLFFNDANAGGFAELWRRDMMGQIVYLSLSNSVGGAIVSAGQVYSGDNQRSGEFGHIPLVPNGRLCYCGKRGCADAYCNAKLLSDVTNGDLGRFFELLNMGDPQCKAVFQEYLQYLAQLVYILRMSFDCDIVLGGYVGSYMKEHLKELMRLVDRWNPFETGGNYVKSCNYRFEASAVGGALYYLDAYLREI